MAELGAESAIIADAFQARPDWTPQQVRDRWAYDQRRIAASDGHLTEGVFFHALRCGQLAPSRSSPQLDPAAYAGDYGYLLGDGKAEGNPIRDRAERITPPTISGADFLFVMQRLALGDSDEQALASLAARRRRGAP
jgi:hypothetical protein